jgi:tRNA pseudouridine55 synthase
MLLGKFTRLAQFFGGLEKTYTGTIRLGFSTDTYDATGQATSEPRTVAITLDTLRSEAAHFHGEMEQTPPVFSAKKIDGKPAYKLARAGKDVVMKPVSITILQFEILAADNNGVEFVMRVSAGGYVRSVAHDMGQRLGCGAHLATLRRVAAGPFVVEQALTLDAIAELARAGMLVDAMPHPRHMLPELPCVGADEATAGRMRNGMAVNLPEFSRASLVKVFEGQRHLIGIAKRVAGTLFQPTVVIG